MSSNAPLFEPVLPVDRRQRFKREEESCPPFPKPNQKLF